MHKHTTHFGKTVGVAFVVLGLLIARRRGASLSLAGIGFVLIALAFTRPRWLHPLYVAWMGLARVLGEIMSRLLLTIIYHLLITPIGLIGRSTGKNFLRDTLEQSTNTYWQPRTEQPRTYEQQF